MPLVDLIENWTQTAVLAGCVGYGIFLCLSPRGGRRFVFLTCALISLMLADLIYSLYICLTGDYPYGFSAADLSYIASYLFFTAEDLYLMERWTPEARQSARQRYRKWAWAAVAFTLAVNVAMLWELYIWDFSIANSLIYLLPICIFAYYAVLVFCAQRGRARLYHGAVLLFLFAELMMFLFSSFGIDFPYRLFDWVWTALFPFLLPLAKRGNEE